MASLSLLEGSEALKTAIVDTILAMMDRIPEALVGVIPAYDR